MLLLIMHTECILSAVQIMFLNSIISFYVIDRFDIAKNNLTHALVGI